MSTEAGLKVETRDGVVRVVDVRSDCTICLAEKGSLSIPHYGVFNPDYAALIARGILLGVAAAKEQR